MMDHLPIFTVDFLFRDMVGSEKGKKKETTFLRSKNGIKCHVFEKHLKRMQLKI